MYTFKRFCFVLVMAINLELNACNRGPFETVNFYENTTRFATNALAHCGPPCSLMRPSHPLGSDFHHAVLAPLGLGFATWLMPGLPLVGGAGDVIRIALTLAAFVAEAYTTSAAANIYNLALRNNAFAPADVTVNDVVDYSSKSITGRSVPIYLTTDWTDYSSMAYLGATAGPIGIMWMVLGCVALAGGGGGGCGSGNSSGSSSSSERSKKEGYICDTGPWEWWDNMDINPCSPPEDENRVLAVPAVASGRRVAAGRRAYITSRYPDVTGLEVGRLPRQAPVAGVATAPGSLINEMYSRRFKQSRCCSWWMAGSLCAAQTVFFITVLAIALQQPKYPCWKVSKI